MYKLLVFSCLLAMAVAAPKPGLLYSAAYTAPAYSAAYTAPLTYSAYSAPLTYAAYSAPYSAYSAPYAAYSAYSYGASSPYVLPYYYK